MGIAGLHSEELGEESEQCFRSSRKEQFPQRGLLFVHISSNAFMRLISSCILCLSLLYNVVEINSDVRFVVVCVFSWFRTINVQLSSL